jgi:hypothetical protein
MKTPADDATLAALQCDFPGFRICLEPTHSQNRYVARRRGTGTGLHTVITKNPAELRAILAAAEAEHGPSPHGHPASPFALPRRRRPT